MTSGGVFVLEQVFDYDANVVPINTVINFTTADASPTGNVCFQVCYGVAEAGGSRDAMNLTACGTTTAVPLLVQYNELHAVINGILPKKTTGSICASAADCHGEEMVAKVTLTTCPISTSTNQIDVQSVTKRQQ